MARYLAGQRRQGQEMHVDWAEVTRQAVANERYRLWREIRDAVERVPTDKQSTRSYSREQRTGAAVKKDVLSIINGVDHG